MPLSLTDLLDGVASVATSFGVANVLPPLVFAAAAIGGVVYLLMRAKRTG